MLNVSTRARASVATPLAQHKPATQAQQRMVTLVSQHPQPTGDQGARLGFRLGLRELQGLAKHLKQPIDAGLRAWLASSGAGSGIGNDHLAGVALDDSSTTGDQPVASADRFVMDPSVHIGDTHYLGEATDAQIKLMADVINRLGAGEPVTGTEALRIDSFGPREVAEFCLAGIVPTREPLSVAFVRDVVIPWAEAFGRGHPGLAEFVSNLSGVTSAAQLQSLISLHFAPGPDGKIAFIKGLDGARHYELLANLSGMEPAAFARLTTTMARDIPFMANLFDTEDPEKLTWAKTYFSGLGERLKTCAPGEAVACVGYHPDTYGVRLDKASNSLIPNSGITHVSVFAVTADGDLSINHHESINFPSKHGVKRNAMTGAVGLLCNTYRTDAAHHHVAVGKNGKTPAVLPVQQSYDLSGPPTIQFAHLKSFSGFKAFNDNLAAQSLTETGLRWMYAADADKHEMALAAALKHGLMSPEEVARSASERQPFQPGVPSPGAIDGRVEEYSNNCALATCRALQHGGHVPLQGVKIDGLTLPELMAVMRKVGILPNTSDEMFMRADRAVDKVPHPTEARVTKAPDGTEKREPVFVDGANFSVDPLGRVVQEQPMRQFFEVGSSKGGWTRDVDGRGVYPAHVPGLDLTRKVDETAAKRVAEAQSKALVKVQARPVALVPLDE